LIHGQQIPADLLDAPCDSIAVQRSQNVESLEDHQGQRALLDVGFLVHNTFVLVSNRNYGTFPLGKQQESFRHKMDLGVSPTLNQSLPVCPSEYAQDSSRPKAAGFIANLKPIQFGFRGFASLLCFC
jgi:hypothetical protein